MPWLLLTQLAQEVPPDERDPGVVELAAPAPEHAPATTTLWLGAGVGVMAPQNDLSLALRPRLEVGVELPVLNGRLQPVAALSWSAPTAAGSASCSARPSPPKVR